MMKLPHLCALVSLISSVCPLVLEAATLTASESFVSEAAHIRAVDPAKALTLYDKALALLTSPDEARSRVKVLGARCTTMIDSVDASLLEKTARDGLAEAINLHAQSESAELHNCLAEAIERTGDYNKAEQELFTAITLAQTSGQIIVLADATVLRGEIRALRSEFADALTDFKFAYAIYDQNKDEDSKIYTLNAIAGVYSDKEVADYGHAIEYFQQVLEAYTVQGRKQGMSSTHFNLGTTYSSKGDSALALNEFRKALDLDQELNDASNIANDQRSIAGVLIRQGHAEEALPLLNAAVNFFEHHDNVQILAESYLSRATALQKLGRPREALLDLSVAFAQFDSTHNLIFLKALEQQRANALASIGDWKNAFQASRREFELQSQLDASMNEKYSARLRVQFNSEKKEAENALLKAQQQVKDSELKASQAIRLWQTVLLVMSIFTLALAFFYLLRTRRDNHLIVATNQALKIKENEVSELSKRMEAVLLEILPAPIAARVVSGEYDIADGYADVTVLFADIVHFTELASTISPRDLVSLLNEIFSAFDAIADELGVEKIKTIGDAYLAASGLPHADPKHAQKIADMALRMASAIKTIAERRAISVSVRIGINTGPVIAGVIGKKRYIFDLWGDTVNLASRMESTAPNASIQVAESTYLLLKNEYDLRYRGEISVKGRGLQNTYLLTGAKSALIANQTL